MNKLWLYRGNIAHTRLLPRYHTFCYPAFFLCFPLHKKSALQSRLFSLNRFNLFSYHDADHGDGQDSEAWARRILARQKITQATGDIWLLTLPRMLGFVFNPVSFWLCHDAQQTLQAIICEVRNTFGERHCYLLVAEDSQAITAQTRLKAEKIFHVSPFFEVTGNYHFHFIQSDSRYTVNINYLQDDNLMLKTALTGQAEALNDRHLITLFLSLGWSTLMVVFRIHWQALRLLLKGIPFHRKPTPPLKEIS
jgi:DUF1365 family protein